MKKWISRLLIFAVVFVSVLGTNTTVFAEENEFPTHIIWSVDGGEPVLMKAVNAYYEYNYYVSARDVAAALRDTDKQFDVHIEKGLISIETGKPYAMQGSENVAFGSEYMEKIFNAKAKLNQITIDGREVRYYNFILQFGKMYDCFLRLSDVAMMFELDIKEEQNVWEVDTQKAYEPDLLQMEAYGYFDGMNSALVADATTGEIFYGKDIDTSYAIASITKLMNYMVLCDAMEEGKVSPTDYVTISEKASRMSRSDDGSIPMKAGKQIPIMELIKAMLVPSCNEAALALAEHVCGSEEAFVSVMNEKAASIGLLSAKFYSSNGLPIYTKNLFAAKLSNEMSARDLFLMIQYLLNQYPQIIEITTIQKELLPTMEKEIVNNNPLLYNMTDIIGLKSGTTTRAGTCLSTLRKVEDLDGQIHLVVAIELGTETSVDRGSYSEVLMRYGSLMVQRGEHGVKAVRGIKPYKAPKLSKDKALLGNFVVERAIYYGLLYE